MKVLLLFSTGALAQNNIDARINKAEEKCRVFLDKVNFGFLKLLNTFRRWSVSHQRSKYPSTRTGSPKS